jgi:diacylglycerol kinase (ATP)
VVDDSGPVLVVWNPHAGRKAGLPTNGFNEATVRRLMAEQRLGDELFVGADEAAVRRRVALAVKDGYGIVVAAGGDGTAGLVARELLGTDCALGILPAGSAMNLARSLGIPRDLEAAARILARRHVRRIDVGLCRDRVFFEMASIGLAAALFEEAQRIDRGRYGSLVDLLGVLARYRPASVALSLDGRSEEMHALMISVAIGPYTGLGLTLAPDAKLDDGVFDVTVYRGFRRWELVRHLASIAAGRHRYSPKVSTFRAGHVRVASRPVQPVRADDDDLGWTPVELRVRRKALLVVAPPAGD